MNSSVFAETFFNEQPQLVEKMLQDILGIPDLRILEVHTEVRRGFPGHKHSVFDVLAMSEGKLFDLEFQMADQKDVLERSIEYQSQLILSRLLKGEKAKSIEKTIVIFFTNFSPNEIDTPFFKLTTQAVDMITDNDQRRNLLGNLVEYKEPERYFVNVKELSKKIYRFYPVGKWAHDLMESSPDKMIHDDMTKRMDYLKNSENGREIMLELDRKIYNEGRIEGKKEGRIEGRKEGVKEGKMKRENEILNKFKNSSKKSYSVDEIIKKISE